MLPVSVILSVYNNVKELPLALDSLLLQSLSDFEVIAVDDGSTDGSGAILDQYAQRDTRVKVIHQENRGLGPSLDRACRMAEGKYLARQDADDVSTPTRFESQVAYLDNHLDVVMCGTWTWFVYPSEGPEFSYEPPDIDSSLRQMLISGTNPFVHGSVMMRRSAFLKTPFGYRLNRDCEDLDLWLQMCELGKLGMVTSVGYHYTSSIGGISHGNLQVRHDLENLVRQLYIERQRLGYEETDWQCAERRIRATHTQIENVHIRQQYASYSHGLLSLQRGDWTDFQVSMKKAAAIDGPLSARAQLLARFAVFAPLIRHLYHWRQRDAHTKFLKPLMTNAPNGSSRQ